MIGRYGRHGIFSNLWDRVLKKIPTFAVSVFKLSVGICYDINSLLAWCW